MESNANTQAAPGGEVGEEGKEGEEVPGCVCMRMTRGPPCLPAPVPWVYSYDLMRRNSPKFTPRWLRVKREGGGLKWKVPPFFRAAERWGESPRKEVASAAAAAAIHLYQ